MLSSYVQHGYADLGMQLFSFMCRTSLRPNDFGLSSALKACIIKGELVAGKLLHGLIIKCGFKYNAFCSSFVLDLDFFVKSGFELDSFVGSAIIEMYVTSGMKADAYKGFPNILICWKKPKPFIHTSWKAFGESDLYLGNSLIEMYAKCKGVDEAAMVFKEMDMHNEFSWTTMISGYIESKRYMEGLELFRDMHSSTLTKLSQFTTVAVLQAC
ncbi:pentatricopeptide repeat-containing protein At5g03800-like [Magnolia sinica]|uniref:pentatricopeptide repeat-containing protein At5g03800-like n=1 Tax=Magnolia sinica TaxID=86752 RepID=UPI0026586D46|nr:pentatricopeptide repeat-containing protein At5g03800-like [Magnolia sinica]